MVLSIATENLKSSSNNSPAQAPVAQIPGKTSHHGNIISSHAPSKSPEYKGKDPPSYIEDSSSEHSDESDQAEELPLVHHHHRRWIDKSSTGGGVILCGLATTFLGAIVCYIRATRRKNNTVYCDKIADPSDKV
ncbi:hypothetical protein Leryth_020484 [Lithospermum erythrorhizon]|nr:hypothetical protein Leryth_020484 [Lithospermum erythrorhizon]